MAWTRVTQGEFGPLGKRLGDSCWDPCTELFSDIRVAIFLEQSLLSEWHKPGENQLPHPLESLLPHHVELKACCRVSSIVWVVEVWADTEGASD